MSLNTLHIYTNKANIIEETIVLFPIPSVKTTDVRYSLSFLLPEFRCTVVSGRGRGDDNSVNLFAGVIVTVGMGAEALAASEAADLVVFAVRVLVAHSPADHAAVVWPFMGGASGAGL